MATDDIADDEILDDDDAPKKGKKGLIIIILLVLLLGGAGAGLYFSGILDDLIDAPPAETEDVAEDSEADSAEASEAGTDAKEGETKAPMVYHTMPDFVANLNPGSGSPSFIKARITVEAPSEETIIRFQAVEPKIRDVINTYIRELRPSDLKGSAGVYRLRDELLMRINKAIAPDKINNVLFEELLIQ